MSCTGKLHVLYRQAACLVEASFMSCTGKLHVLYRQAACLVEASFMSCTGKFHSWRGKLHVLHAHES